MSNNSNYLPVCQVNNRWFISQGYKKHYESTINKIIFINGLTTQINVCEDHYDYLTFDENGKLLSRKAIAV